MDRHTNLHWDDDKQTDKWTDKQRNRQTYELALGL